MDQNSYCLEFCFAKLTSSKFWIRAIEGEGKTSGVLVLEFLKSILYDTRCEKKLANLPFCFGYRHFI